MENNFYLIVCIVFAAGFIQGLSGFGSAIIAIPLLTFFLDVKTAVPLVVMLGIIIGLINSRELIQYNQTRLLAPLIFTALCGIPVGILFIKSVQESFVLLVLSILLISYSLYTLLGLKSRIFSHHIVGYLAGFFSGLLGATVSISGPPVILYATAQDWSAKEKKSLLATYFLLVTIFTAIGFYMSGLLNDEVMILFGYSVIPLIVGTYAGIFVFNTIGSSHQNILINLFVLVLGAILLVKTVVA